MSNGAENKILTQGRLATRLVLALSALILVLSCPIKKFLQLNAPAQVKTQAVVKQKQELEVSAHVNANCSSFQENQLVRVYDFSAHQQLRYPVLAVHHSSGFEISYDLSRSKSTTTHSAYTCLFFPLFLQHRSLLI